MLCHKSSASRKPGPHIERIIRRQINPLIFEKLDFEFTRSLGNYVPEDDEEFAFPDLDAEVKLKKDQIVQAVLRAFNKDRQEEKKKEVLAWINVNEVKRLVDQFYAQLLKTFDPWLLERDNIFKEVLAVSMEKAKIARKNPKLAAQLSDAAGSIRSQGET